MGKHRNGALDLQKFIFSVLMVLFHSRKIAAKGEDSLFIGGTVLVEYFFLVSGVLLAAASTKDMDSGRPIAADTILFMKRKITGLMPNYYVAWILSFVVLHIYRTDTILKDLINSVWSLLLTTETGLRQYHPNAVAWYIGAMLLVMLAVYPLIRRCGNMWFYVIAPLAVIFMMGYSFQNWTKLDSPHTWFGLGYKGMYRAVMEICLGSICYKIAAALAVVPLKKLARMVLSVVSWGGLFAVTAYLWAHKSGRYGWLIILIFAVSITITFSGADAFSRACTHPILNQLGIFSYSLYLSHYCWCKTVSKFMPCATYSQKLPVYVAFSFVTAFIVYFISLWLKKCCPPNKLRKLIIEE